MRFAILVLSVGLWGCASGERFDEWDEIDPGVQQRLLKATARPLVDPEGRLICHHGCPVDPAGEPLAAVISIEEVESDAPLPPRLCSRYIQGMMPGRAQRHPRSDAGDEDRAADNRPTGIADTDNSGTNLSERLGVCRWDLDASLELRVRDSMDVPEIRSLEGPLYAADAKKHAEVGGYFVPTGYWKVLSVLPGAHLLTVALIVPNAVTPDDDICPYIVTIDEVEDASGQDLFPLATDDSFEATRGDLAGAIGC